MLRCFELFGTPVAKDHVQKETQLVEKAKGATMPAFRVTSIIDGDTFAVSPEWKWNGETGTRVRPAGYDAPELHTAKGQKAKDALSKLINGQQVELRTSSGSNRLDESARKTVHQWKFVPAKRGGVAVESWVLVPIIFKLEE